ncbi:MAG: hypothetical protein WCA27_19640 [Candidatus Sulfotelmatobacter sp.]
MMISNVKGEFTAITGKLELNSNDITNHELWPLSMPLRLTPETRSAMRT